MSHVTYSNSLANDIRGHVLYIATSSTNLLVSNVHFYCCFSEDAGSAIHFTSGEIEVRKICAFNCSSHVKLEDEPGGALMYIVHKSTEMNKVKLEMISSTKSPDTTNTYSSISLCYGSIEYTYINATHNTAWCDASMYILCSSGQSSVTKGEFINIVNCHSIGETLFLHQFTHSVQKMNLIQCMCEHIGNGIIRFTTSKVTIKNGVFLNNTGHLFVAVKDSGLATLQNCYFPKTFLSTGPGKVEGSSVESMDPILISFAECEIKCFCSGKKHGIPSLYAHVQSCLFVLLTNTNN